ncbi:MAG: hypothetical protein N5P05_003061 [Chroococcopsis gigantea SAG 12.99]|nr:transglutaminase family protein [Chlorogloea purpurea SAG 13.99]MDV3001455.1 hypothetical protein [Chroococcopsis gigantea SAG 12.99]
MLLNAGCEISFTTTIATPVILMLRPRSGSGQWIIREEYLINPRLSVSEYTDNYGNLCQRLSVPPGDLTIKTTLDVDTADQIDVQPGAPLVTVEKLPENVLKYLLPSRYCQSDLLGKLSLEIIGDNTPGYDQVEAIRHWINSNIEYAYGTSDASTSAVDTARERIGVCRDFAHLGIALCRSIDIPARMVVGYLYGLEPMDLHAWFEAYVGDRWYTFDATQTRPLGNRITIAYGHDATHVALATQFGPLQITGMKVWVDKSTVV